MSLTRLRFWGNCFLFPLIPSKFGVYIIIHIYVVISTYSTLHSSFASLRIGDVGTTPSFQPRTAVGNMFSFVGIRGSYAGIVMQVEAGYEFYLGGRRRKLYYTACPQPLPALWRRKLPSPTLFIFTSFLLPMILVSLLGFWWGVGMYRWFQSLRMMSRVSVFLWNVWGPFQEGGGWVSGYAVLAGIGINDALWGWVLLLMRLTICLNCSGWLEHFFVSNVLLTGCVEIRSCFSAFLHVLF